MVILQPLYTCSSYIHSIILWVEHLINRGTRIERRGNRQVFFKSKLDEPTINTGIYILVLYKRDSRWIVFYHFVGAVPNSGSLLLMLRRLLHEIGFGGVSISAFRFAFWKKSFNINIRDVFIVCAYDCLN